MPLPDNTETPTNAPGGTIADNPTAAAASNFLTRQLAQQRAEQINARVQTNGQTLEAQRAAQLRAKSPGELTPADYTQLNHGLQALPHIANNGG